MKKLTIYTVLAILMFSCEIRQTDVKPTDEFVKVYNHPDESLLYYSTSVVQHAEGFIILSGVKTAGGQHPKAVIIGTNKLGEVQWTTETEVLSPVPKLLDIAGNIYFIGMDNSYNGQLVLVDPASGQTSVTALEVNNPLAAKVLSNNNIVILGYDNDWFSTVSLYGPGFNRENHHRFGIGEDYASSIREHQQKTGREYPFFIGEWNSSSSGGYFVNGLYNSSVSTRFFYDYGDPSGGWIYTHQIRNGPTSLIHKEENLFALTQTNYGQNFFSPTIEVDINSTQNFDDSLKTPIYELPQDAKIHSNRFTFNQNEFIFLTSATNFNSIIISQYKFNSDIVYHTKTVDFSDKIEVVDVIQDADDEGILVLGRLLVTGRYLRPFLVKIPKRHFKTE